MKRLSRNILFDSQHLSRGLARKSVQGGISTMTTEGMKFVLRIVGTVVLAPLLTPRNYGLTGGLAV